MQLLFKVVTREEVSNFEKLKDSVNKEMSSCGFIHLSNKSNIKKIIERKYNNDNFYVLILDSDILGDSNIRYEVGKDGESYPHLYDVKGLLEDCNKYVPAVQLLRYTL